MDSYYGAEIWELVGLFILNHLGKKFSKKNMGIGTTVWKFLKIEQQIWQTKPEKSFIKFSNSLA